MKALSALIVLTSLLLCVACEWLSPPIFDNRPDVFVKCIKVSETPGDYGSPVSVWAGSEWGIAWHEYFHCNDYVHFAIVSGNGSRKFVRKTITGSQSSQSPSLCWSGNCFGLAWSEKINGKDYIRCARITNEGTIRGDKLTVSGGAEHAGNPTIVWNENTKEFGIAWEDDRNGIPTLFFIGIDEQDGLSGSDEIMVTSGSHESRYPSVSAFNDDFAITWQEKDPLIFNVFLNVIHDSGCNPIDKIPVSDQGQYSTNPMLVWNKRDFGLTWISDSRLYFLMFDALLNEIQPAYCVTGDGYEAASPALVWNGSNFCCAWQQKTGETEEGDIIHFQKFGEDGEPAGPERYIARKSLPGNVQSMECPMLSWNGRDLSLVFSAVLSENRGKDIYLAY